MMHKRNNEGGGSQCCEQLPKPLSFISAGSLELDKLLFYVIRNRWPTFSYSQNISGWAFHTFATSRASPPPPFIIHPALKTPPSNTWPALLVYIFILLRLAWTKGLLIFQEAGDFADIYIFFLPANLKETKQFLISYCNATVMDIIYNLPLLCSHRHHLVAGINVSLMSWELMSWNFSLLSARTLFPHYTTFAQDFFLTTFIIFICSNLTNEAFSTGDCHCSHAVIWLQLTCCAWQV